MLHDLIIWPRAIGYAESILGDLHHSFRVIASGSILWGQDKWYDNIRVFYSKSLLGYSPQKRKETFRSKAAYCGMGPFLLVVFEDSTPSMVYEQTSDGKSYVNARVFNKKKEYRELTGGGHLVHTSNNPQETDRDLSLLLGFGAEDFLRINGNGEEKHFELRRNCSGVDGYDSLSSFFYTLNHTINYCVLRNFDCLPDHFFEDGHEDIDLLVDNLTHMVQLTSAKPISRKKDRVDYSIRIGGEDIPFDLRHFNDNYYDTAWERKILEHRRLERDAFYVPGEEDLYYSLLYHVYVQKRQIKLDYLLKLQRFGEKTGVVFTHDIPTVFCQLDAFMQKHGYEYIAPKDKTVVFNLENLAFSHYAFRKGRCIKHTEEIGQNGYIYSSKVFDNNDNFSKEGTDWLIENEARFLGKLSRFERFPKVLTKSTLDGGMESLTLSRIAGIRADQFFDDPSHQRVCLVRSYITQMVNLLFLLWENGIEHRDLIPSNILVHRQGDKVVVGIIDFGWAIALGDTDAKFPTGLGVHYALENNHSDSYAVGIFLMDYWPDVPQIRWLARTLLRAATDPLRLLKQAKKISRLPFGPYARFRLFLHRRWNLVLLLRHMKNTLRSRLRIACGKN